LAEDEGLNEATGIRNIVASASVTRRELVNMDNALDKLQRALAEAGYAPR
jgi:hypothetical protein